MRAPRQVNIHEAKTNLSRLVQEVAESGRELIIARAGRPVARLVPMDAPHPVRKAGVLKGKIRISADFDAPLPDDVLRAFEGEE
jgi:prevent-host-death family protein